MDVIVHTRDGGLGRHRVGIIVDHEAKYYQFFDPNDGITTWHKYDNFITGIVDKLKDESRYVGGVREIASYR